MARADNGCARYTGAGRALAKLALGARALALAAIAAGCSVDYSEATFEESLADRIPNSVIYDFEHNVVRDGRLAFRLSATKAEIYDKARKTLLTFVSFEEYDMATGGILTKGKADHADLDTSTNDIVISGRIDFESRRDDISLSTEYLTWDDSEKRLVGRDDLVTEVRRSNGTVLSGAGFQAEARDRSVTFTERVDGVIVVDDEETEE